MQNKITNEQYDKLVKHYTPNSKLQYNFLKAFLSGGLICMLGQLFHDLISLINLDEKSIDILVVIIMVGLGAILTGLNIYQRIGKFAGAGSIVPITGFANSVVSPAMEFKSEGLITGTGAKMFIIAGPVLVYGISTSIIVGLLKMLFESLIK